MPNETISEFITALNKIAEKCDFPDVEDRLRDALVCGILSEEIQSMLLMNSMLTFKVAQEMALAHEAAVRNVAEIKDGKPQEEINVMGRAVKKLGHISRVCKNGNWRSDRNNNCSIDEEAEAIYGLFNINQVKDTSNMRNYMVKVRTSGRDMNMLIDTGTRKNIISEKTYIETWVNSERPRIEKDYTKLVQWNRQRLSILGKIKADVKVNKRSITMEFLVIEGPGPNLIGREAFDQIGIGLEWMNYGDSVCQINEVMNGNGMAAAMNGTANGMMSGANGMGAGYMNGGEGMYSEGDGLSVYGNPGVDFPLFASVPRDQLPMRTTGASWILRRSGGTHQGWRKHLGQKAQDIPSASLAQTVKRGGRIDGCKRERQRDVSHGERKKKENELIKKNKKNILFLWGIPMDHKKRKLSPSTQQARRPQPGTSHQTIATQDRVAMPPQPPKKHAVTQLKNNKQQQALSKSRSAAATFDQCCFVEWRTDLSPLDYIKALEEELGKSSVFQIMKMSGQVLVGLASVKELLVEEGLTIRTIHLKAFPYKKRAEKITIGNLPIAIRDEDVVAALRPYCRVVSLNHEVVTSGGYTWTTGNREAFILLNEGRKLHQLPAKLVIVSKGESTPAYITYGIECGKCHRKGHRRAPCPLKAHKSRPAHLQDTRGGPESPSSQPTTSTNSAERSSDTAAANYSVPPQMTPSAESFVSVPCLPGPSSTAAVPTENGAIPFGVTTTNAEISAENNSVKNVSISETNEKYAKSPVTSGGYANSPQSSRNWADIVENDENFEQPKKRKRLLPSESASQSLPGPSRQTKTTRDSTTPRQPSYPRNTIEQIKVSRQMLAQCRSKAAAGTYDQMTYLEFSPEFTQVDYIKALENKLGKGCVVQIGKASGQILVGFERPDMAETIIEDGLMIKGALLKALPYQKKAEKITISGLPFVIEDADIIRTLRPYCQVVSIAPTVNSSGGYTWLDLKKTAFILMNNGKKITDLPKKIIVTAKGGSALAYLEYGFRCSKCYRMGHKRMNCPRIIRETSTTQPLSQTSSAKTTAPAPNTTAAASPPATFSHPAPVAAPAQTSSAPPAQEDIALETEPTTRTPETSTQTDLNINRVENSSHHKIKDRSRSLSPKAGSTALLQLDTLLERLPGSFFEEVTLLGLKEEEVKQAIVSLPHLRLLLEKLSVEQSLGLHTFNEKLIKGLGSSKSAFYKRLSDIRTKTRSAQELPPCHAVDIAFIQETNVTTLDSVEDLCLGYRAAVAPASGARGSGLTCIFSSGVQVIGQQVLSPGKIAAFDVTIRGSKATFVNCHLSHAPDERLQQLQVIAAAAVNEDAWVLGDLNISEESASDIASGSVEALGELLDRANLVDAPAIFDATHLPTRISSCGSRVDASRLDRVLIPSSFSNRVTRYWSLYYKNSDHRAVLLQTGEASEPRPPCIASMLRSRLVVGTVETLLDEALGNIEDMRNAEIWRRWGHIKAHLASAIKSLHDLRNNDDDYISRARKYVQAKLEDVSIYSDYPSLPDLGRAFRLRRRRTSSNTFYDSAGRMITGPAVRELAFVNLKERFSHPSCSPEDIDGFLRGFTLRVTIEESDPLHRYGIGEEEIVAAIGRLPTGKAAGWDDLPCELFRGFEDYFASALRRVFEASQLCGALPTSMRRSEMSLIEKPHGGPGLAGLRPLSLPTTDYRVLSGVLYWRLRPHLRDIVPECQSYAVPGRTPAWNIARVADEVATACRDEAPLAVVAIDLESAFDTLDRSFLVSTLLSVGLPPVFVGWVLLLYAGAKAAARIEGIGITPLFHMLNGVRQGCAASAAFFTISTGPLLLRLEPLLGRDNVLAYADDIVLLIREDGQLEVVRKIFEDFRRASGIRVNFGKSQGLWCGRWRNRTDSPSAISWNREKINILGTLVTPGMGTSAQDQHLQELLERAIARWSPFVRGLSLAGRAKAANSLVLSAIYYHLQAYLPSETTIGRLQARLARFVWGHDRTSWLPSSILARPISVRGKGLLDVGTQLRLSCLKGVQAALRGGRNAHSWLAESGMWLTPASTPGIWLPPRRRRSLHLFEPAAEILDLNHRILQPALLRALRVVGDCRFLRPPELLAPTRWLGWRIGELTGPAPNITIATRGALTDVAALGSFCTRLITQNARGRYRVDSLADAIVVRGTTTAFQRLTTRTARRLLERPRLAALPITQLFGRWFPHVSIPISISWSSLRRCAFSGHNADVAVRLALHALPHPAHPASARESCIACGSGDLSLAHRYWSCSRIRPVILEAFTIIQRPPDLQSWIFGLDLEDDALAIMASAKTRIYKHFLGLEMRGVQEDPLLVWRRTLSSQENGLQAHMNFTENPQVSTEISAKESDMAESLSDSNNRKDDNSEPAADGGHANSRRNWADCPELDDQLPEAEDGIFSTVGGSKKRPHDPDHTNSAAKKGCTQAPRILSNSSRPRSAPKPSKVRECQTTRQKQATFRARSAAAQVDQCVYLEYCPDFVQEQYFRALEAKLGKGSVYQLTKMEGQYLVCLSSIQQADKLVEDGLELEDALLRATPLKKRAERIMIGNVPFFIENGDLVAALRPYGQITSIVQKMMELGDSYWADARREAFITLRDCVKLSHIPARLEIKAKGVTSHVYVTYGIKCSLCYKHGHKRANCPRKTGVQEANLLLHPAAPNNAGRGLPSSLNTKPALVLTPAAGTTSTAAPTPAPSQAFTAVPSSAAQAQPTAAVDPAPPSPGVPNGSQKTKSSSQEKPKAPVAPEEMKEEEVLVSTPSGTPKKTRMQLNKLLEAVPSDILDHPGLLGFERGEVLEALTTIPETNTSSLDLIQHLCLGYSAATVPPAALRGSGLACFFAPGVAVLRQRVLWPGNISIVSIDVRGQEVRVIDCHLSHIPRERLEQLKSITAAAIQEDAWVVGDLNIDEPSPSDITSGSVEALTELMDQTALVDVTTLFDAEHLPTRVASCRSRVDAARLDRILLPSRLLERVTLYKTIYYRLSDHRAVLTQMGSPPSPRQPCVAAMLRSALVDEHLLATIEITSESIADMSSNALWIRWSKIKAELLAEPRHWPSPLDIVLLIRRDELFDVVRIIFEDFRRASGIGVNFAKCKGLWCGAWRARTDAQLGISWTSEQIRVLGCNLTPVVSSSAQEQHLLALLESAVARWVPFTRGLSLVGRARAANSLVLSAVVHHLHGYLPTDSTIAKLQARLMRFVWGPRRTTWLPGDVLARPVSVGGFGLLDIGTQLRLACLRGVQTALRGGLNAYSWLAVSGTWLTPPTSGTWHPPRRRRLLKLWEAVSEILELNHRVLPPHQLQELHIIGDSRFLRPPDLLVASRWAGMRVGDLTSSSSLPLRTTRAALADIAALTTFCSRIVEENRNHTHRVDNIKDAIVLRGTATAFQRLTTRTARRMLESPRLAALPITQLLARWIPHVSIPISISWPSLRRVAFSGHNADVAVRLVLHALPHPAHPASARDSCIACGSEDLSLAHRYWS
ncbi:hypothetical protein LAZ67_19001841, partial [Cordylochernes scorpioides]